MSTLRVRQIEPAIASVRWLNIVRVRVRDRQTRLGDRWRGLRSKPSSQRILATSGPPEVQLTGVLEKSHDGSARSVL
jgi:hypothetical protein